MIQYKRISDEERNKIPADLRCEVSYNGYHTWDILKNEIKPLAICRKCLKQIRIETQPLEVDKPL